MLAWNIIKEQTFQVTKDIDDELIELKDHVKLEVVLIHMIHNE